MQFSPATNYVLPSREQRPEFDEPSAKRQRTSIDLSNRDAYNRNPGYTLPNYPDQFASYSAYPAPSTQSSTYPPSFPQGVLSASSGLSDFSFRTPPQSAGPIAGTPSYIASGSQTSVYIPSVPTASYQQQSTYAPQPYQQHQYSLPNRQIPLHTQPVLPHRQFDPSEQHHSGNPSAYTRPHMVDDLSVTPAGGRRMSSPSRSNYNGYHNGQSSQQTEQLMGPPLQSRQDVLHAPLSNVLPPLQSAIPSVPSAISLIPVHDNYVGAGSQQLASLAAQSNYQTYQDRYGRLPQDGATRQFHREPG